MGIRGLIWHSPSRRPTRCNVGATGSPPTPAVAKEAVTPMRHARLTRSALSLVLGLGVVTIVLALPTTAALPTKYGVTADAVGASPQLEWERLNPGSPPGHERMRCHRVEAGELGVNATSSDSAWVCPSWLSSQTCASTTRVIDGVFAYTPKPSGARFSQREQLLLTNDGNMTLIWADFAFACPWFQRFSMALEANPFPLPFDGVHAPKPDCVFRP